MGDRLVEIEGDRDDQTMEESQGRAAEGNITREDLLREQTGKQTEKLAEGEGDTGNQTPLEENEESLAEGKGVTGDKTLEENEEREAEGNRTPEDIEKDEIEMWTGMKRFLDKHEKDAGAASELELQMTNIAKEQIDRILRNARETVNPTVQNKTGKTVDWKDFEDFCKGQIDLMNAFREIHDPTVEKIKGRLAEPMERIADVCQNFVAGQQAALKEKENPTEEDNEGISLDKMGSFEDLLRVSINSVPHLWKCIDDIKHDTDIAGPLAEIPLNVNDLKRNVTERVAFVARNLDNLPGLPPEIRRMDKDSQHLFQEALEAGKEKVYNIRLMVVGHLGVGKTTLTKRILGEEVAEAPHVSTEGIEVHPRCIKIDLDTKEWIVEGTEHRFSDPSRQHLVNIIAEHVEHKSKISTDQVKKNTPTKQDKNDSIQQEEIGSFATGGAVTASSEPNIVLCRRQGDTGINRNRNKSDLETFVTKNRSMTRSERVFCYVTMLDFAGQFAFYSTHQAFMSWRTLYLLVTDMSKGLDDVVKDDKCCMSLNRNIERSIKDYAVFWLNSIYSHGTKAEASPQCEGSIHQETGNHEQDHHGDGKYPPVILVATHSDKVPGGENKKTQDKYFDGVRRILKDRPQRFLLKGYSALNNFGPEIDIDALKQKIFELAEQQDYWGEEIPGRWLALEQKLMELKRNGEKIIEYSRVEEINNDRDVKIENPDELEVFLRFEHDLGNIVFFPTEKLRENVVLDTEWLMDGVKILISPPRHMREDPEIYPQIYAFLDTGRLAKSLIGSMWSGREQEDFHKNQDHLLDCLEKLSIIAKSVEQDVSVEKEYYWVPCVIYKSAPDHVKNPKPYEGMTKTSTLCFESTTKFIHIGVFHCLVASFLSKWPPAQEEEGGEYRIYDGCCEFKVDKCHNLLLAQNDYVILATMFRVSSGGKYPDNELCNAVRNLIFITLADITSCICPNSMFDICVKCEKSSTDTIKGLHKISDKSEKRCVCSSPPHAVKVESLLKFWEVGPEQSEMVYEDSEYHNQGDLHRTVLNRCLQQLILDLDIESVLLSIQQKELFGDVTLRDILELETTSKKIMALIERVKQGGPKAYEMFKECLVETKQTTLLEQLEHQEAEFQSHGNSC